MPGRLSRLCLFVLLSLPAAAHGRQPAEDRNAQTAAFRRGQHVYIAAFHYPIARNRYVVDRAIEIQHHLGAEQLVRKEFEKAGYFVPVDKPSEADYIFVVYIRDETVEGLAVPTDKYAQFKSHLFKGDLDPLREAAYGRYVVGPFKLPILSRMSTELVRKFHAETVRSN